MARGRRVRSLGTNRELSGALYTCDKSGNVGPEESEMQLTRKPLIQSLTCAALAATLAVCLPGCQTNKKDIVTIPAPPAFDTAKAVQLAEQGLTAQRAGDLDTAISLYKQSINANPELSGVWTNMGVAMMAKQNFPAAAEAFKHALDLSPTDSRPLVNLGVAYLDRGWADQAYTYFSQALDRDPQNIDALRGAITAAQRCGREDERTLDYIKRLQLIETDPKWKQELGFRRVRLENSLKDRNKGIQMPARNSPQFPQQQSSPGALPPIAPSPAPIQSLPPG
ncbi:MAG: tetratricopeptide repeat protein [Phycisphaerales bacterium]|nr:tetratricopeptide repeat protein [Phycisphaerales bacterium]